MSIYSNAVKRPITTIMIFVALVVVGVYSLYNLPIDLYPKMEPPIITIMTTYPGANASDVEENVTKVLENSLNSVDGLDEQTSNSFENLSVITLKFDWEQDLSEAANDARDAIEFAMDQLPDGIDRPRLLKFNTSMFPILFYTVTADESYSGIYKTLDEQLVNRLNRVEGVGSVALDGTPTRVVYIDLDPKRMEAYNITIEQIGQLIQAENFDLPSGNIKMGLMDYQFRVEGEFAESSVINDVVVGYQGGNSIFIKDIATVRDTIRDITLEQRVDGKNGCVMFIMKQSGANTVEVARKVKEEIALVEGSLPPDIELTLLMDSADFINKSILNLSSTLMWAMIFVVLVVLFFLGRWRATFIVVLTIPISLLVAFIYLNITGQTINIISLASLSIAIGMVVDDAIVVLENITRHIERGSTPRQAAIYATNEVWLSVIVTTMVVVAVFFPLTLITGMTGVFFKQLGWIICITVVTSTFAAITLTPMLASLLLKLRKKKKNPKRFSYDRTIAPMLNHLDRGYEKAIRWILRHKSVTLLFFLFVFISTMMLITKISTDFMPQSDENALRASIELQTGLRVEESKKVAKEVEKMMKENYPEIFLINSSYGSDIDGGFQSMFSASGSNIINIRSRLVDAEDRERNVFVIADDFRDQLKKFPEIINFTVTTSSNQMSGANNVQVEIYGYDFTQTNLIAERFKEQMLQIEGAEDISISRMNDKPELQLSLDQRKLAKLGLSTVQVASALRNRVFGLYASKYKEDGDQYDIIVRFNEESRNSITDLENISINTPFGTTVKLKEIGKIEEFWSPPNIQRKRKERYVTVSAVPAKGKSLGDIAAEVEKIIANTPVPPEVLIAIGGTYEDQKESNADMALLMVIALALVYIVMASQFESFKLPLIIMLSIPFAFSGVVLALYITGTTLSMVASLGAIMLVGIVVKNGIVLVDYINLLRDRGIPLYDALALAGKSRLRPVLMTAFTTILGMLPMTMSSGSGAEIWSPMGISVIGGLIFSTLITLFIVPVAYASMTRSGGRNKIKKIRKNFSFMNEYIDNK